MGLLISTLLQILTFPGIIAHEFAHKICCDMLNVKVFEVKYFRFGNPAGYVIHEETPVYYKNFLICIAPLLISTAFAIFIFTWRLSVHSPRFSDVLFWLGVSIAINSFPSKTDSNNLWRETIKAQKQNKAIWLVTPIVAIVHLMALSAYLLLNVAYAAALFILVEKHFKIN